MTTITKENVLAQLPNDPDGLYKHFGVENGSNKEKRLLDILVGLTKKKIVSYSNGMYQVGSKATNRELTLLEQARLSERKETNG